IIALIIVVLSSLVSVVIYVLFSQPAVLISKEPVQDPLLVEPPERIRKDDIILILIATGVFILLLLIIVYNALKERKQLELEAKKLLENLPSIKKGK
ncbi:MAG: hypothetical protein LBD79_04875, partial [Treponema sp.]|nr:hypothetical protein [Treponema sp.]